MSRYSRPIRLLCTTGLVTLLGMAPGAGTGFAQSVNDMVRTLNNIVNPGDAQRLEDQARLNNRPQEERYWHDYRRAEPLPTETDAIMGVTVIDRAIVSKVTTATSATRVFKAIAATAAIATREIIPTIGVKPGYSPAGRQYMPAC
jgi:hypothetical protein